MDWWRASTSMRCGLATFGSRVLVRSVPAVRPLIYLLTYLRGMWAVPWGTEHRSGDTNTWAPGYYGLRALEHMVNP